MATTPITIQSPSPFTTPIGGRHRVDAPLAAIHLAFAAVAAWVLWIADMSGWLKDYADYLEDRVLSRRLHRALIPAAAIVVPLVVFVVGSAVNW